ncbi:MAG: hypothetical protein KAI81_04255 [Candidatus Marinimicrobia bacterium]|nr:hypothetical protein [Candidatus Neomarinimicrobiota bacterium]
MELQSNKTKNQSRREEMFAHIRKMENLEINQRQYCESNALALSTFSYWLRQYREQQEVTGNTGFIPLNISHHTERRLELDLPDGLNLRIYY